jgi:hypothetical protein
MSIDSMGVEFKEAIQNTEILDLSADVDKFLIDQMNLNLLSNEFNVYKNTIIHFIKNKWSICNNTDDMYFCCRLLYMFQLVFLNDYNTEFVSEYIEMLRIKIDIKDNWNFSLYLVLLCCIDNHNSDNIITIESNKVFFHNEIHLEKNIIRAFVDNILRKNVVFDSNLISIY